MTDSDSRLPTDAIADFRSRADRHAVEDGVIDLVVGSRPTVSQETPNGR